MNGQISANGLNVPNLVVEVRKHPIEVLSNQHYTEEKIAKEKIYRLKAVMINLVLV